MIGIMKYGVYFPYTRISRKTVTNAWGMASIPGEKAIGNYDEDSISMATSAALNCIDNFNRSDIDMVSFATTTPSYKEKHLSPMISGVLNLKETVRTIDFKGSIRGCTSAIISAMDGINSHSINSCLIVGADRRLSFPKSQSELTKGDGSAAILMGRENIIAKTIDAYSLSKEILTTWRGEDDLFIQNAEDKFILAKYEEIVKKIVNDILKKNDLNVSDINTVLIDAPDPKIQIRVTGKLGFSVPSIITKLQNQMGNIGAANPLLMLNAVLENSLPNEKILLVSFDGGADAILFETTELIKKALPKKKIIDYLETKDNSVTYNDYLKWRGLLQVEPPRRPEIEKPSIPALFRGYSQNLALQGNRCTTCGSIQFPKQRVCVSCLAKDRMEEYSLLGKRGKIFAFTSDYLAATMSSPLNLAVIDFIEGCRMMLEVTDCNKEEIFEGREVELSFRKLYEVKGLCNYAWKAVLLR